MDNSSRHDSTDKGKSRYSADFPAAAQDGTLQEMEKLIPDLKKRDLANMKPDEKDEAI